MVVVVFINEWRKKKKKWGRNKHLLTYTNSNQWAPCKYTMSKIMQILILNRKLNHPFLEGRLQLQRMSSTTCAEVDKLLFPSSSIDTKPAYHMLTHSAGVIYSWGNMSAKKDSIKKSISKYPTSATSVPVMTMHAIFV